MKRLKTPLLVVAAIVLLGSCRAPVFLSGYIPFSINIEVPADLSSDVPTAVRKAMADEIRGASGSSASRFIHPDASYAVATIAGEGVTLTTDAVPVSAGSVAELSFNAVPVRSGLTLTVRVYDETGAIVGERVVEGIDLGSGQATRLSVGIVPYEAHDLLVGENGEPESLDIADTGASCYLFKAALSSPGLFSIRGFMNGDIPGPTAASMTLYDTEGKLVSGYYADPEDQASYGLFVNESDEESTYYLVYTIGPDWSSGPVGVEATQYTSAIAVYGKTSPDDSSARLLAPSSYINFGTVGSIDDTLPVSIMEFTVRNLTDAPLSISAIEATTTDGAAYGSFSLIVGAPTVLLAKKEETIQVQLEDGENNFDNMAGSLTVNSDDPILPAFEFSLSGICAC